MPELPDVVVYLECLKPRIVGRYLERIHVTSPFLVRSVDPPLSVLERKKVIGLGRLGKRLVFELDDELFVVLHLMVAGRLRWREGKTRPPGRSGLASFGFTTGTVVLSEAGTRKRASLHVVRGRAGVAEHDRGGLEIPDSSLRAFTERLRRRNHTLKRALCDPTLFSGIGNAYSDEILHRARLSPVALTQRIDEAAVERLWRAARDTLLEWIDRLRREAGDRFPETVTAFRDGMAVHGRYRKPCPDCGTPVQRISYVDNETDYCPGCQTGGRLLADRALSRLLKSDWPRTLEELEERRASARERVRGA